jgi:hypothetical protein
MTCLKRTPRPVSVPREDPRGLLPSASSRPALAAIPSVLGTLVLLLAMLVLVGCADTDPTPTGPDSVRQVDVAMPLPTVHVGDTMRVSAVARDARGTVVEGVVFTWRSSDTLVARVNDTGLLTALATGSATIRASTSGRSGQVVVGVIQPPAPPPPVPTLDVLSPAEVLERSAELDLVVEGVDFRAGSRVLWNEVPLATTFVSDTRLVARIPAPFLQQPLEVAISVESVTAPGAGGHPRSGMRTFRILPRPLASVHLEAAGNHVFSGQLLEYEVVMRNDLGEAVSRPGLGLFTGDESVLGFDWMGNLIGRATGTTSVRASVGNLSSEVVITVGGAPVQRLVVVARPQGIPELFLLDFGRLGGQPPRFERILPAGTRAAEPAVTPDGSVIAFAGVAPDGSVNVWTVRFDGTDLRRLTNDAFRADQPAWSPDGARLAFRTFRRGIPEIWVMSADGSEPRPLMGGPTFIPEEESHFPAWLPDGRRIVFSRGLGAERTLHVARVDQGIPTANVAELVRIPGYHAERPAPAAQGGTMAFEARDRETGEVRILMASTVNGTLLYPLNPPAAGILRPAMLGGDWLAAIGPGEIQGQTVPTLRIQELNGMRISIPIPSWIGRIESVAPGAR